MTTDEALQQIHILLEKNIDYPTVGDEDYTVRLALLKDAVQTWENEEGVLWNELFVSLADAADGDKETVAEQSDYDCPSDFKFPAGYLKIATNNFYPLVRPENVQKYDPNNGERYWYVTGNKATGYTYHLHPIPTVGGETINFNYYKNASLPTSGSSVLEMSDPQFAVYWALAELTKEENPGLAQNYLDIAMAKLRAMRTKNIMPAFWQDNQIEDYFVDYQFGK
jgi:hypothetical protein